MSFDIPKDAVFPEILVLRNISSFPAVNWAPKWAKTVNSVCIPSEPKFKLFEEFFKHCVYLIGRLPLVENYHRYIS